MPMKTRRYTKFPLDWAELFALSHAEVAVILESLLDGDLTMAEAQAHYLHHRQEHGYRVEKLAIEAARLHGELKNSVRQE